MTRNGNIASKTTVGDYTYRTDGTRPHAVTSVTNPSGLIPTTNQKVTYTSFNKVDSIIEGTAVYTIQYGFANERTLSKPYSNGVWQKKTYYVGNYEMDSLAGSSYPKKIHYIYGGDGIAAIYITQYSTSNMYYVHTDHLGSIDVMTNQSGTAVQYMSFDACLPARSEAKAGGRRRNHTDWTYTNVPTSFLVSRGYTMHEHLDQFGLINMNGRVYDPVLGRFLEPDNYVQAPGFTQSYNRYSYCWNNPLRYTDPSGYRTWWDNFKRWAKKEGDQFGDWQRKHNIDDVLILVGSLTNPITGSFTVLSFVGSLVDFFANKCDLSRLDPTNPGTIMNNNAEITEGLFKGSGNQIFSRFTKELPQTLVGYNVSQLANSVGHARSVSFLDGATLVEHYSTKMNSYTLGSYINAVKGTKADPEDPKFQHEYGHYLQSQDAGWWYVPGFAIPSGWSTWMDDGTQDESDRHSARAVEQDANMRARAHFFKNKWDYDKNPIFGSGENYYFDKYYSKYKTRNGLINTPRWVTPLMIYLFVF